MEWMKEKGKKEIYISQAIYSLLRFLFFLNNKCIYQTYFNGKFCFIMFLNFAVHYPGIVIIIYMVYRQCGLSPTSSWYTGRSRATS